MLAMYGTNEMDLSLNAWRRPVRSAIDVFVANKYLSYISYILYMFCWLTNERSVANNYILYIYYILDIYIYII